MPTILGILNGNPTDKSNDFISTFLKPAFCTDPPISLSKLHPVVQTLHAGFKYLWNLRIPAFWEITCSK